MADDTNPRTQRRLWLSVFLFLSMSAVAMGFALVWINVERNNLAYSLRLAYVERKNMLNHIAKLSSEVGELLSPHILGARAAEFGLHNPKPSQAWRIGEEH